MVDEKSASISSESSRWVGRRQSVKVPKAAVFNKARKSLVSVLTPSVPGIAAIGGGIIVIPGIRIISIMGVGVIFCAAVGGAVFIFPDKAGHLVANHGPWRGRNGKSIAACIEFGIGMGMHGIVCILAVIRLPRLRAGYDGFIVIADALARIRHRAPGRTDKNHST